MKNFGKLLVLMLMFTMIYSLAQAARINSSNQSSFIETTHNRNTEYGAQFEMYQQRTDALELSFHTKTFDKEAAEDTFSQITGDMRKIARVLNLPKQTPSLYIVPQTLSGTIQVFGSRVYCTPEDIANGSYREALVSAMFNIREPWIFKGATAYVFDGEVDIEALKAYYAEAETLELLSLFAFHFTDFASKEDQWLVRETAISLCRYIIDKYGCEALFLHTQEYAQQWLKELGVDREYIDPYAGFFDGYQYASDDKYALIVTSARGDKFYLNIGNNVVETAEELKEMLFELYEGTQKILAYIESNAPDYYPIIMEEYAAPIYYYYDKNGSTHTQQDRVIIQAETHTILHETVHVMVPNINLPHVIIWQQEAIAEYLTAAVYPLAGYKIRYFQTLTHFYRQESDEAAFIRLVQAYYMKYAELPASRQELDVVLFLKAFAVASLQRPDLKSVSGLNLSVTETRDKIYPNGNNHGNELSYPQALSFADYLVNEMDYGLSAILRYNLEKNCSFEEVFEMDYPTLKEMWLAYILSE